MNAKSAFLAVLALIATTSVFGSDLINLGEQFRVSDAGRVSIGPTLATQERFLLEDVTPGERTFTIRSVDPDGVTIKDRVILEKNVGVPFDLNFRNVVLQAGSTNSAVSSACPILNYTPPGSFGSQFTIYKPGSSTLPALMIMATGQTRYIDNALTTDAISLLGAVGDANPRFAASYASGAMRWGAGGSAPTDTGIARTGPGAMTLTGSLAVTGGIVGGVTQIVASTVLTGSEGLVVADTTAGQVTVTLPTAAGKTGVTVMLKRGANGTNDAVLSTTAAQTIDGAATKALKAPWAGVKVQSDGANWLVIENLGTVQ